MTEFVAGMSKVDCKKVGLGVREYQKRPAFWFGWIFVGWYGIIYLIGGNWKGVGNYGYEAC